MAAVTETVTVDSVRRRLLLPQPGALKSRLPVETGATGKQRPKSTVRLDPVRILEPARKKLSSLEAQRIVGTLRDTIGKAEVVVSLPSVLRCLEDERRGLFEEETVRALERHRALLTGIGAEAFEEMLWASGSYEGDERDKEEGLEAAAGKIGEGLDGENVRPKEKHSEGAQRKASQMEEEEEKDKKEEDGGELVKDRHSESGRTTMTTDKSDVSDINEEEEEEEEEEEKEEEEEEDDDDEASYEESETAEGASETSVPFARMEIPHHSLTMIAESCRNLLRSFPTNQKPVFDLLDECRSCWKESSSEVIQCLKDLQGVLTTMLLMSPAEELERARCLRELVENERCNSEIIARLSAELKAAEEEKKETIMRQNDVIRRLQSSLHSIEMTSDEYVCRMKVEAEKQMAADKKTLAAKLTKLQQDLIHVQAQYTSLKAEHKEKELALRRRKYQVETEVENWIQTFDMDMGERQDEYERNDLMYTEEKRQLNELEEKFRRLEAEYLQIQEERRIAREKRNVAERELQTCIRAATTIQALWRSFKVRKAIKAKKKKGVKKGKK